MENASKALLIAGGVLIAIIIIAMFIMVFNKLANMQKTQEEQLQLEQLLAFNAEYEAYDKRVMYGVDVITLLNKVAENNKNYLGNSDYTINIVVKVKNNGSEITIYDANSLLAIKDSEKKIFECTKMDYNSSGRVCEIEIQSKS